MIGYSFGQAIGKKFNADGSVRHFPGNTIICLLDRSCDAFRRVKELKDLLSGSAVKDCLVLLPDESIHMTAIEGVCDSVRESAFWVRDFSLDAPLTAVDDHMQEKWKGVPKLGRVRMRFDSLNVDTGISITLYPASYDDDKRIRDWRDIASETIGIRFPGHDRYRFHIGIAYGIRVPRQVEAFCLEKIRDSFNEACLREKFEFDLPDPELTFFENMFFFSRERIIR